MADELFALLPGVYRSRDSERGDVLRALLRLPEEELVSLRQDLLGWYANWFVETCDDAVLGHLAQLTGLEPAASRRDVADAVLNRQTKGTAAGLEAVALDATGWPARAVESFPRLIRDQHVRFVRHERPVSLDLRDAVACDRLGGPFDDAPYRADVRRPASTLTRGWDGIPDLAVYLWRLISFQVTAAPAFCVDQRYNRYLVNVLGIDTQLFPPQPAGAEPAYLAGPPQVPHPIRRVELQAALASYYGPGLSLMIWRDSDRIPVPAEQIVVSDLTDWAYRPRAGQVAVDPELGRIAFSPDDAPEDGVWVSWHYGFSARMGGGEYRRPMTAPAGRAVYRVGAGQPYASITAALAAWAQDKEDAQQQEDGELPVPHDALVEITDSADYTEAVRADLGWDDRLEIRAGAGCRPVIRLLNQRANRFDALLVRSDEREPPLGTPTDCPPPAARRPRLLLDGLVITGRSVDVVGQIGRVTLQHCTLVPGWTLDHDCRPRHGDEPSLELRRTTARLVVEHSILGTILVDQDEVATEPLRIDICDSIVDAAGNVDDDDALAIGGMDERYAYAVLTLSRSTVFGEVQVHAARLIQDSLITGCLHTARPAASSVTTSAARPGEHWPPGTAPVFTGARYGTPGYAQLGAACPAAFTEGAHDGAELGAFHDLQQPRRLAVLAHRLAEYVPVGLEVHTEFVT